MIALSPADTERAENVVDQLDELFGTTCGHSHDCKAKAHKIVATALATARAEGRAERLADRVDAARVIAWMDDSERKPPDLAFTAGPERQIADRLAMARAKGWRAGVEDAAVAALCALPRAHTYASENADVYRAQDDALQIAARKIRALAGPVEREGT